MRRASDSQDRQGADLTDPAALIEEARRLAPFYCAATVANLADALESALADLDAAKREREKTRQLTAAMSDKMAGAVVRAKEVIGEIAASSNHALSVFGDGCVGAVTKVRVRGSDPPEYREICACPVCYARDALARLDGEDG